MVQVFRGGTATETLQALKQQQWAAGHGTMPQVPLQCQATGSGSREQPVSGSDGAVAQEAAVHHTGQLVLGWELQVQQVRDRDG